VLQASPDHTDYDEGIELWVAKLVAQVEIMHPVGPNQWGEVHPDAAPTVAGTKAEFEDAVRAFLMLIGADGGGRLQNHVANFNIAKHQAEERAEKTRAEAAAASLLAAKVQEEERVKAEKPTATFAEDVLFDLMERVEATTGFTIFPVQINNTACATKLYDNVRRNRLPSAPEQLPDQGKSFMGADGGVRKVSQAKVLQAATGADGVAYLVAEEGEIGESKGSAATVALPIAIAHGNTSRWLFTLLLVGHHLPPTAPFKMSPQATLAYLNMLWQVGLTRGMTAESYHGYRQESHREMTRTYNKGGVSMDAVLTEAMKTLHSDMSSFIKTPGSRIPAADKPDAEAAPMNIDNDCAKCEKLKKHLEQMRAECHNKGKTIATLEADLVRLRSGGLGRRNGGGFYDRDFARKEDRDRSRDQDRGRQPELRRSAGPPPPAEEAGAAREKD
jgi:hypothetical protein